MRTIMQGLILTGVIWLARSVSDQNASIAGMQVQLAELKATFDGIPDMKERLTKLEMIQADLTRRQNADDARREAAHQQDNTMKGWTR